MSIGEESILIGHKNIFVSLKHQRNKIVRYSINPAEIFYSIGNKILTTPVQQCPSPIQA